MSGLPTKEDRIHDATVQGSDNVAGRYRCRARDDAATPRRRTMRINRRSLLRFSLAWPATVPFWSGPLLRASESKEDRRKETLTKERPAKADSLADAIVIKNENVFFVARPDGNVPLMNSHGMGLYYHDCRYVNGYEMEL